MNRTLEGTMRTYCVERRKLDELYGEAKTKLAKLLLELSRCADSPENGGFERAWEATKSQRRLCGQVFEQIQEHLGQSRCT